MHQCRFVILIRQQHCNCYELNDIIRKEMRNLYFKAWVYRCLPWDTHDCSMYRGMSAASIEHVHHVVITGTFTLWYASWARPNQSRRVSFKQHLFLQNNDGAWQQLFQTVSKWNMYVLIHPLVNRNNRSTFHQKIRFACLRFYMVPPAIPYTKRRPLFPLSIDCLSFSCGVLMPKTFSISQWCYIYKSQLIVWRSCTYV